MMAYIKVEEFKEVVHLNNVTYEFWVDHAFTVYFIFASMSEFEQQEVKWVFGNEERYLEVKEAVMSLQNVQSL